MEIRLKKIISLIFALFVCSCNIVNAEYVKTWEPLNVRTSTSTSSVVLDKLPRGQFVIVQNNHNGWSYIKYASSKQYCFGWVKSEFLSKEFVFSAPTDPNELAYQKELEQLRKKHQAIQDKAFAIYQKEYKDCIRKQEEKLKQEENECIEWSRLYYNYCQARYDTSKSYAENEAIRLERHAECKTLNPRPKPEWECKNTYKLNNNLCVSVSRQSEIEKQLGPDFYQEERLLEEKYNIQRKPFVPVINVRIVE